MEELNTIIEQIFKWKRETQSQIQQQVCSLLEQKLSMASKLNSERLILEEEHLT